MKELWKDIKGYEGQFQVSNTGKVKSLQRNKKYKNRKTNEIISEKLLSICDNGRGYKVVYLKVDGKKKSKYVHRLVAEAFIENVNNLKEVNHKDFNKSNNNIENLEWVNRKENLLHFKNSDRYEPAMNMRNNKLKIKSTQRLKQFEKEVCKLYLQGNTIKEINLKTKLGNNKIAQIVNNNDIKCITKIEIIAYINDEKYIFDGWDAVINWVKSNRQSIAQPHTIATEIRRANKNQEKRYGYYWNIQKKTKYGAKI